jgi:hypothetical protein
MTADVLYVNFGDSIVKGSPEFTRKVRAVAHVPVDSLEIVIVPPVCTVRFERDKVHPDRFDLFITPSPTLPVGPFEGKVKVRVVQEKTRLHGLTFGVKGEIQSEMRLLPARLFLPPTTVGEVAEAMVLVSHPNAKGFAIDHWEVDTKEITIEPCPMTDQPTGKVFRVAWRLTKSGDHQSEVRCVFRKPDKSLETVTMAVSTLGVQPEVIK